MLATYAVTMVKNEADVIGPIVEHMLGQVDHVIVADNGSTDGTYDILDALPVTLVDDPDPAHYQSIKMTRLAHMAADMGADWVVPFDADEWWYSPAGRIGDVLGGITEYSVAEAALYDHVPTAIDPSGDPTVRMGWRRREPSPLRKVACRTDPRLVIADGNHDATYGAWAPRRIDGVLIVRHFPYRSPEQFVAKAKQGAAALRLTNLPVHTGAHWRGYADIAETQGDDALVGVFHEHFHSAQPTTDGALIYDPVVP